MEEHLSELQAEANKLFEEGKYFEAEPLLKDIVKIRPEYADVHNKLGFIAHLRGDLKKAVEHFETALKINPFYTEAALNLAVTYNEMGEFDKAKNVITKAAQSVHPSQPELDKFAAGKLANEHLKLGNLYLDFAMVDEAIEEYKKGLKLAPNFPDLHTRLGMALRTKGNFEEAIVHFQKAKEVNPKYGPAWIQLGITYYMKGLVGLAVEEWQKALEINPDLKEAEAYLSFIKSEENP